MAAEIKAIFTGTYPRTVPTTLSAQSGDETPIVLGQLTDAERDQFDSFMRHVMNRLNGVEVDA